MKKISFLLCLSLIGYCAMAQTEVMGKIDKVTIYPSSALIEKSITANLQRGENKFVIHGNATLGTSDLHFAQSSDWFITSMYSQAAGLTENETLARLMPAAAFTQYQTLCTQIDDLNLRISNARILIAALEQQAAALNNLKAVRNTQAFDTIVNLKAQFEYQRKESQAINSAKAKSAKEIEDLTAKLRQLTQDKENMIRKYSGGRTVQTNQNDIYVTIYSNKSIPNAKIDYSYRASHVSCGYSYDVMLDENSKSAVFNLKASVSQNTGENWTSCPLVFSTTDAGYAGFDAELPTYTLDFRRPVTYTATPKAKLARNTIVMSEMATAEERDAAPATLNSMSLRSNQTLSHEYSLRMAQTIPSGESPKMLLLQNDSTQALFARYSTPKNEEKVYFTALLPHWEDLGLLDVSCNVYLNNRFVSLSDIQTAGSGDTLRFSVGQDPNVLVKRKLAISSPEKGGFITKEVTETVTITLNIKNTKNEPITLNLKDQVPISANSEIQILDIKTDGGTLDSRTGVVRWMVPLKALEQKNVTLTYSVKYPKEKESLIDLR